MRGLWLVHLKKQCKVAAAADSQGFWCSEHEVVIAFQIPHSPFPPPCHPMRLHAARPPYQPRRASTGHLSASSLVEHRTVPAVSGITTSVCM